MRLINIKQTCPFQVLCASPLWSFRLVFFLFFFFFIFPNGWFSRKKNWKHVSNRLPNFKIRVLKCLWNETKSCLKQPYSIAGKVLTKNIFILPLLFLLDLHKDMQPSETIYCADIFLWWHLRVCTFHASFESTAVDTVEIVMADNRLSNTEGNTVQ